MVCVFAKKTEVPYGRNGNMTLGWRFRMILAYIPVRTCEVYMIDMKVTIFFLFFFRMFNYTFVEGRSMLFLLTIVYVNKVLKFETTKIIYIIIKQNVDKKR